MKDEGKWALGLALTPRLWLSFALLTRSWISKRDFELDP
jgi:hypothetical protein